MFTSSRRVCCTAVNNFRWIPGSTEKDSFSFFCVRPPVSRLTPINRNYTDRTQNRTTRKLTTRPRHLLYCTAEELRNSCRIRDLISSYPIYCTSTSFDPWAIQCTVHALHSTHEPSYVLYVHFIRPMDRVTHHKIFSSCLLHDLSAPFQLSYTILHTAFKTVYYTSFERIAGW